MEPEDKKSKQDDHEWFDALSGKTDSGQGAKLRRTLRKLEQTDAAQEDITHDWHRLKFALKREMAQKEKKTIFGWRYFAIAASVLVVIGVANLLTRKDSNQYQASNIDRDVVMRGRSEQVVFSKDPAQESKQLESELLHLGVKVSRNNTKDGIRLNIPLSYPVSSEVRAAIEARIIPVPEQGDLTVIFMPSPK